MKKIYFLLLFSTVFYACEKKEVPDPSLEISLKKTTYAVNEPIEFQFKGTADLITFYSGQPGKEFQLRERIKVDGTPQMNFTSYRQPALAAGTTDNSLRILTSTNFRGVYSPDYIASAKWTDITNRATLSTGTNGTPSGTIDLSDVSTQDSLVYIAFKYAASKSTAAQPSWTINALSIDNVVEVGPPVKKVNVKTIANLTWNAVDILNPDKLWSNPTSTALALVGAPANAEDNEDWLISQPVDLKRVPRDLGVSIKTNPKLKLSSYGFTYPAAGKYKVTFEVVNVNKYETKTTLKEFEITVE